MTTLAAVAAVPAKAATTELLVYDWNKPITKAERGFPRHFPPTKNGNWTTPVNFAEGTFYYRAIVRSQPVAQAVRLQYCIWQDNFVRESCSKAKDFTATPGKVVTWSQSVAGIWKKGGVAIDWSRKRQVDGFAIENQSGQSISNYANWNWHGANPDAWYPFDVHLQVVVVAKGATFSGWSNY